MSEFAIITYVHNESFYLPVWLKHYLQSFEGQDVYVINNNGTDGSIEQAQKEYTFNRLELKTQYNHDFVAISRFLTESLDKLFKTYNGVFITEIDEILWHPNGLLPMAQFYHSLPVDAVRSIGYEPVHDHFNGEPSLQKDQSFLYQRQFWREAHWMRKPVYLNKTIDYFAILHAFDTAYPFADYQLTLVHLKFLDYDVLWERNLKTLAEANFSPKTLEINFGWQNRMEKQQEFDFMFQHARSQSVYIPEQFKHII